jgi:hypothetical protein
VQQLCDGCGQTPAGLQPSIKLGTVSMRRNDQCGSSAIGNTAVRESLESIWGDKACFLLVRSALENADREPDHALGSRPHRTAPQSDRARFGNLAITLFAKRSLL